MPAAAGDAMLDWRATGSRLKDGLPAYATRRAFRSRARRSGEEQARSRHGDKPEDLRHEHRYY